MILDGSYLEFSYCEQVHVIQLVYNQMDNDRLYRIHISPNDTKGIVSIPRNDSIQNIRLPVWLEKWMFDMIYAFTSFRCS